MLLWVGQLIDPPPISPRCRDPKDDAILALAIAGKADVLISGDQDLLCLDPLDGLRLLSPRQFLDLWPAKAD